ncbi:MAG TPA: acyl carrier protein [Pyrinomonadaceae bacterium]|nr:acyl carrier protein [Pyrinomonadaceae bacterium]
MVVDSSSEEDADDPILHELKGMFAEELKTDISSLELDTDFTEFGVDSILASVIVQRIREQFGDAITLSAIVEPTVPILMKDQMCCISRPKSSCQSKTGLARKLTTSSAITITPSPGDSW